MAIIKLSAIERRRLSAYITCLVFAVFAWLFTTLSNPYKYTVKQPLRYINSPQKKAFHSLQSDTVNAVVQGTGWQMLFSRVSDQRKSVLVDLQGLETKNYVVLSPQLKRINAKKDIDREIIAFTPDTLFFDFSSRSVKRVAVQLVKDIKYQKQFSQAGNIVIKPSYVTLSGPADVLARITSWKTDSLKLTDLNESYSTRLNLRPPNEGNVEVLPKSVQVSLPVDEYTEKTLAVPVKVINNHNFYDVKIFPQKVKVTFTTALRDYDDLNEDDFEAVVDLDNWRHRGYTILPVKVKRFPTYSRIVKIEPQNVDFIIRK